MQHARKCILKTSPESPHKSLPVSPLPFTWGRGQQAQSPASVLQHVDFPGQDVDLSHLLFTVSKGTVGTLLSQDVTALPEGSSHVEAARLQMVSWGQQWRWSSQHTAYREEEQTRCGCDKQSCNVNITSVSAGKPPPPPYWPPLIENVPRLNGT